MCHGFVNRFLYPCVISVLFAFAIVIIKQYEYLLRPFIIIITIIACYCYCYCVFTRIDRAILSSAVYCALTHINPSSCRVSYLLFVLLLSALFHTFCTFAFQRHLWKGKFCLTLLLFLFLRIVDRWK